MGQRFTTCKLWDPIWERMPEDRRSILVGWNMYVYISLSWALSKRLYILGSEWGTHVYLWWIHFNIWQNQYNIVKFKNKIKSIKICKKKKKKNVYFKSFKFFPIPSGAVSKLMVPRERCMAASLSESALRRLSSKSPTWRQSKKQNCWYCSNNRKHILFTTLLINPSYYILNSPS